MADWNRQRSYIGGNQEGGAGPCYTKTMLILSLKKNIYLGLEVNSADTKQIGTIIFREYSTMSTSSPSLISPPNLPRNCGHIREVAFGNREK